MTDEEFFKRLAEIKEKRATFESPYDAGRDCAINGANTDNCNFRWFSSPESTAEWERGKRDGGTHGDG